MRQMKNYGHKNYEKQIKNIPMITKQDKMNKKIKKIQQNK